MATLVKEFDAFQKENGLDFYKDQVPLYIPSNLKQSFDIRPYQYEAFGRFVHYWEKYADRNRNTPTQLLYHMATGSGKTLIMAGLMLYLYEKGYRNFLFFVNSTNIIEKTKENFLNSQGSKYLFSKNIYFRDKQVAVNEVANFQSAKQNDINICFCTVQGLHSLLNTPRENSLTYDDFENEKIVLISDEAHHINAETKKGKELSNEDIENLTSWESTITRIFNANSQNVMLEFTATADLANLVIAEKYDNKLLFDYPLRQFRMDGYSKEVQVLQADLEPIDRALQSVLLSQYRRKLFEKNGLNIKPVILFKSKTINDSISFQTQFAARIKSLHASELERIKATNSASIIGKMFDFCDQNAILLENLVHELQVDFGEERHISVNSKNESIDKQIAINSLEDERNPYRVIFAVDKLNEGWDVLNLFDIVRLYDTRDAKKGMPGRTTMQEAQLIGRGARYCPFRVTEAQPLSLRKFDDDEDNELRVCEELYYHSSHNPKYINELHSALIQIGLKTPSTIQHEIKLKDHFRKIDFFKNGFVYKNSLLKNNHKDVFCMDKLMKTNLFPVALKTEQTMSAKILDHKHSKAKDLLLTSKEVAFSCFSERLVRKVMNQLDFYRFEHLRSYFPNLGSVKEFITSPHYLASIKIVVSGLPKQLEVFSLENELFIVHQTLINIAEMITSNNREQIGNQTFKPFPVCEIITDKTIQLSIDQSTYKEAGIMLNKSNSDEQFDLSPHSWYAQTGCIGTEEEKRFIRLFDQIYETLCTEYSDIYLIHNIRLITIYSFDDGKATVPNFVLFMTSVKNTNPVHYQIHVDLNDAHDHKMRDDKNSLRTKLRTLEKAECLFSEGYHKVLRIPICI